MADRQNVIIIIDGDSTIDRKTNRQAGMQAGRQAYLSNNLFCICIAALFCACKVLLPSVQRMRTYRDL
jgi:hypothetical protein